MSKFTGLDVLVYVDVADTSTPSLKLIGGQSGATLSREAESIDVTSKDSSNDGYSEFLPGLKTWTIEMEGFIVLDDEAFDLLEEKFESREPVSVELTFPSGKKYSGQASITSFENDFPQDDGATYSVTLEGLGKLTITPASP